MASKIQLSRGSLKAYGANKLARGELFWVPNNTSNNSETNYRDDINLPWDEGTLYVGWPSLEEGGTSQQPLAIGGSRAYKSLNYKGKITKDIQDKSDPKFDYVREGDFFIFDEDAVGGEFLGFKKEDILLVIHAEYNIEADGNDDIGKVNKDTLSYIKIRTGSGDASAITFDNKGTNFAADNVQSALEELEYEKLSYRGIIDSAEFINSANNLEIGSLYLNTKDNLQYQGVDEYGNPVSYTAQKGDFVIFHGYSDNQKLTGKKTGWELIPSGYTDAVEIDYSPNDVPSVEGEGSVLDKVRKEGSTFDDVHKQGVAALTNVKETLDFLLLNKAQLDSHGKVPLSQLHDTVLGAMQYRGTWSPLIEQEDARKNNIDNQSPWPTDTTDESESTEKGPFKGTNRPGDYYIVKCPPGIKNIQYIDKTSLITGRPLNSTNTEDYERVIEFNNGDWIVYTASVYTAGEDRIYHWEKIDNTDRISSVNFTINGKEEGQYNYAVSVEPSDLSLVGSPKLVASHKIVLINNGDDTVEIAGTHLVDQRVNDPSKKNRIPRYYDDATNTIENSTIENIEAAEGKKAETHTHSNFYVGEELEHYDQYNYGNIYIFPHIEYDDSQQPREEDSVIQYKIKVFDDATNGTVETLTTLRADASQEADHESDVILPNRTSTIIGKLDGIQLLSGRITKSTADGYIESSSIHEHMSAEGPYNDENVVSVEFKADDVIAKHFNTEAVIFVLDKEVGEDGRVSEVITSELRKNPNQVQKAVNYLPATDGILINTHDISNLISGTVGRLSVFTDAYVPVGASQSTKSSTLTDSLIYQTNEVNKLLSILKSNRNTLEVNNAYENLYTGKNSIVVETDMIIGQVDDSGTIIPKSLAVTKNFIMGNNDTVKTTIWSDSKSFKEGGSTQFKNALTEEDIELKDVDVALPTVGGVLLTDNSRIDGREWRPDGY